MIMHKIVLPFFTALLLLSTPALAEKGGHGSDKGHGKSHKTEKSHSHGKAQKESKSGKHAPDKGHHYSDHGDTVIIVDADRIIIRDYIAQHFVANCPPGLAKKRNGCLPPGQAKKLYSIGRPLPGDVTWVPVPDALLGKLRPVPTGHRYVMVDKDVLLISEASKHVIDAITLLSAVGD